jgi:hypothetical protein
MNEVDSRGNSHPNVYVALAVFESAGGVHGTSIAGIDVLSVRYSDGEYL